MSESTMFSFTQIIFAKPNNHHRPNQRCFISTTLTNSTLRFSLSLRCSQASQGQHYRSGATDHRHTLSNNLHIHTVTACGCMSQQFDAHRCRSAGWLFRETLVAQPAAGQRRVKLRVRSHDSPFTPALNMPLTSRFFSRSESGQRHLRGSFNLNIRRIISPVLHLFKFRNSVGTDKLFFLFSSTEQFIIMLINKIVWQHNTSLLLWKLAFIDNRNSVI